MIEQARRDDESFASRALDVNNTGDEDARIAHQKTSAFHIAARRNRTVLRNKPQQARQMSAKPFHVQGSHFPGVGNAEAVIPDAGQTRHMLEATAQGIGAEHLAARMDMDARRARMLQAVQKIPVRGQAFLVFAEFVGQAGPHGRAGSRPIGKIRIDAQAHRARHVPACADGVDPLQLGIGISDNQAFIQRFPQIVIAFTGG